MSAALLRGGRNREPSRDRLPLCFMSAIRKRRRPIFASTRCRLLKQRPCFSIHWRSPFPTRTTRMRKIERSPGSSLKQRVLFVSHCERGDRVRIISARRATRKERLQYE